MPSRRWIRHLLRAAVVALLAADTAQLRRRLAALPVLPTAPGPAPRPSPAVEPAMAPHLAAAVARHPSAAVRAPVLPAPRRPVDPPAPEPPGAETVADGVLLTPAVRAAAHEHRRREGLAALDLIPADLPLAQAMDLLREVDPATCRMDRLTPGRTAAHAIAADPALLDGLDLPEHPTAPDLATAALELKLRAPDSTALAVAPDLAAAPAVRRQDAAVRQATHGPGLPIHLLVQAAGLVTLGAAALTGRRWAAGLLAAYSLQPLLVFAGSRTLKPADLVKASLTRAVAEPARLLRTLARTAPARAARASAIATSRIAYQADLAAGLGRFFDQPRHDCPWCGGADLRRRLVARDLHTHKPGRFVLAACGECGHVFQNPMLTPAGLEFYYRDVYDGLNEHALQGLFASRRDYFLNQARSLQRHAKPQRWLDVGTGHGHFCNMAREIWPHTRFDGVDFSSGVELAQRRGILDRAYRGQFTDLAAELAGTYDAISMFHYLEHTTEPVAELRAAHTALAPGGHLVIDVPDPESRFARLLGRYWGGWVQPQHLHLYPLANLRAKLAELGFTVVGVQRREADAPDLTVAAWLLINDLAPRSDQPWLARPPGWGRQAGRAATLAAALPVLLTAMLADRLLDPVAEGLRLCNAYRIVARRD